jgi:hypothetical protein
MNSRIRYADLWALLRRLGYDCDRTAFQADQRDDRRAGWDVPVII